MEIQYILVNKEPVHEPNLFKWGLWMETANRHVGKDVVGSYQVSTVFLGLDHNFALNGPPILFETMIFKYPRPTLKEMAEMIEGKIDDSHEFDDICERYSTWKEAERGHRKIVQMLKLIGGARGITDIP